MQSAAGPTPRKVLVIDDDRDIARVISILVSHCGYEVRVAHDAVTSLEVAREFQPDVALLDIGLPDMTGYELARRLREEAGMQQALLVALTGYAQDEDRALSHAAGIDVHLVKPVTLDALEEVLSRRAAKE